MTDNNDEDAKRLADRISSLREKLAPYSFQGDFQRQAEAHIRVLPHLTYSIRSFSMPLVELANASEKKLIAEYVTRMEVVAEILEGRNPNDLSEDEKASINAKLNEKPSGYYTTGSLSEVYAALKAASRITQKLPIIVAAEIDKIRKFENQLAERFESAKKGHEELKDSLSKSQVILDGLRDTAAEFGVQEHASLYSSMAKAYERSATKWLFASIALSLSVIVALFWLVTASAPTGNILHDVATLVAKLLGLSVASSFIVFCGRNFMTAKHNAASSKQRESALLSFRSFVDSVDDRQIRDAVILAAAQASFGPQATGYIKDSSDAPHGLQIVEVLRAAKDLK